MTDGPAHGLRIDADLSRRMRDLFPTDVGAVAVVASGWEGDPVIVDGEAPPGMAVSRAAEFALGRGCARAALSRLGGPWVAIPPTRGGAPDWPDGFAGSISHGAGLAAAVVAADGPGLGIDVDDARVDEEDRGRIFLTAAEREWMVGRAAPGLGLGWEGVLFCAKEAVFKAQPPERTADLGLRDFSLVSDPEDRGRFAVPTLAPTTVSWIQVGRVVLAGAVRRP